MTDTNLEAVPQAMKDSPRWVLWRAERRPGDKPTDKLAKVPHQANGRNADSSDPATWTTFDLALAAADRFDGLGFVLGDGIAGVDLDKCLDPQTGHLEPWAAKIVNSLQSYTEVSPSGTGLHVLCRGELPPGGRQRKGNIELYDGTKGRYFCVTGRHLEGTPPDLRERKAELARLHADTFGDGEPAGRKRTARQAQAEAQAPAAAAIGDGIAGDFPTAEHEALLENSPAYKELWDGTRVFGSQSERELAIANRLVQAGLPDPKIATLLREARRLSGEKPEKADRGDYIARTIAKARAGMEPEGGPDAEAVTIGGPSAAELKLLHFNRTDAGNAELFAHLYGERLRYDHKRGRWLVWGEHRWQPDADGDLGRLAKDAARARYEAASKAGDDDARKWAFGSENRSRIEAAIHLARSERPLADDGEGWDADPLLLACPNGVVDLATGTLRPGRPEDRITRQTTVPFDPAATCPRWQQFLGEVFDGDPELEEFIRRAVGYSLTGDMSEQCFFLCHGKGSNGKGVFVNTLRAILGDYAADTPFTTFELKARADIPADMAALEGRRFVTASETSENSRLNEARIKAWTGQDPITARFMRENFFTFYPQGKLWLSANHRPLVDDESEGFWRRVRLVPFDRQFLGQDADTRLADKLKEEAPGILAWAVQGAAAWQAGGIQVPERVRAAVDNYRAEADPLAEFIACRCLIRDACRVPSSKLFADYEVWCLEQHIPSGQRLTHTAFGRRIGERYCQRRETIAGKKQRVYLGIGLASEGEE